VTIRAGSGSTLDRISTVIAISISISISMAGRE